MPTDEVLAHFGTNSKKAVVAYRQYLEDGWKMGKQERLTGGGLRRSAGGWQNVMEMKRNQEFWRGEEQILGDDEFVRRAIKQAEEEMEKRAKQKRAGWTLERLAEKVCLMMGVKIHELKKRGRCNNLSRAKGLIAYWGKTEIGQSGAEIARFLGMSRTGFQKVFSVGEKYTYERELKWEN